MLTQPWRTPHEQDIIRALMIGEASLLTIHGRIYRETDRTPSIDVLHVTLDRLEEGGIVASRWGETTPVQDMRRRHYRLVKK